MYYEDECFCCNGVDFIEWPAIIAPFISSYVLKKSPVLTKLVECKNCSCRFFIDRFSEIEVNILYKNYRGDDYFRQRRKHEFWYSRRINDKNITNTDEINIRRNRITNYLAEFKNYFDADSQDPSIKSMLDFGGDKGQFIPKSLNMEKYVYEISGCESIQGVNIISKEDDLALMKFDFIMLCHVLEHYSDPRLCLEKIKTLLRNEKSLIYIELPFERYDLKYIKKSAVYTTYLRGILKLKPLFYLFDFISTFIRVKLNIIPPFGFVKLHEHINFFNKKSLEKLLMINGINVLDCRVIKDKSGAGTVLCCLAQKA